MPAQKSTRVFYEDKKGNRSVIFIDDRHIRTNTAEEKDDEASSALVDEVGAALLKQGLLVVRPDSVGAVKKFMVLGPDSPWGGEEPAPSVWIIDIELLLGPRALARDGIELAGKIRHHEGTGVTLPSRGGVNRPIPILFLTRFKLTDMLRGDRDTILKRIQNEVGVGWRFFRKDLAGNGDPVLEECFEIALPRVWTVADFATEVKQVARG